MSMVSKNILKKFENIKIVLTDVDGVLTDGGMYYTKDGDVMKKFFVRDGMGVTLLRKQGIPTMIVTKERNIITKIWATKMKIKKIYQGITKKEEILEKVCKNYHVKAEEVAYIGDDINDLELLRRVGLSVAPYDASEDAKKISDYTCKHLSGNGAFRELADLILFTQNNKHKKYS